MTSSPRRTLTLRTLVAPAVVVAALLGGLATVAGASVASSGSVIFTHRIQGPERPNVAASPEISLFAVSPSVVAGAGG